MRRSVRLLVVAVTLHGSVQMAAAQGIADITIHHIRVEPAPAIHLSPTILLKFDLRNESGGSVTDIVVRISLHAAPSGADDEARDLIRPFKIWIDRKLMAGYSLHHEIRLRNVSFDAGPVPRVDVLAVRRVDDGAVNVPAVSRRTSSR